MTEKKQGAAEWLRGIAQRKCNCHEVVRMFGFACGESPCTECIPRLVGAIADRIDSERALPEGIEWPRFEDGELVRPGDEVGSDEPFTAKEIAFESERWLIKASSRSAFGCFHGAFGERAKRPTPKVLDADGVPIEVGDTVYCDDGEGPLRVTFVNTSGYCTVLLEDNDGKHCSLDPERLTHKRLDSWERLEQDAKGGPTGYARDILGVNVRTTTTSEDYEAFARDIVRRAKALAKAGE